MVAGMRVVAPRINLGSSMRDLLHEVRLIQSSLDAQLSRLERVERDLVVLSGVRSAGSAGLMVSGTEPVALNLHSRICSDGSVDFSIDGGAKFSLGPRLAEVFQFLASGDKDRSGQDVLVGWRSRREIISVLENSTGKKISGNYVNSIVYLIRRALLGAGYDRNLIQTHRQKGVRLAYKCSSGRWQGASALNV
jgi:hypothetical protein